MNYPSSRSCPMPNRECSSRSAFRRETSCGCSDRVEDTNIYVHADALPLAMAYVPAKNLAALLNCAEPFRRAPSFLICANHSAEGGDADEKLQLQIQGNAFKNHQ